MNLERMQSGFDGAGKAMVPPAKTVMAQLDIVACNARHHGVPWFGTAWFGMANDDGEGLQMQQRVGRGAGWRR